MLSPRKNIVFVQNSPRFNTRPAQPFFNYSLGGISRPNIIYMKEHATKKNIRQIEKIMSASSKPFIPAMVRSEQKNKRKKIPKESPEILTILKGGAKKSHLLSTQKVSHGRSKNKVAKKTCHETKHTAPKRSQNITLEDSATYTKEKKQKCQKKTNKVAPSQERLNEEKNETKIELEKNNSQEDQKINNLFEKNKSMSGKSNEKEEEQRSLDAEAMEEKEDENSDTEDTEDTEESEDEDSEDEEDEEEEEDADPKVETSESDEESEEDGQEEKDEISTESEEEELFESSKNYNKVGYGSGKKKKKKATLKKQKKNLSSRMRDKEEQALANALMHPLKVLFCFNIK